MRASGIRRSFDGADAEQSKVDSHTHTADGANYNILLDECNYSVIEIFVELFVEIHIYTDLYIFTRAQLYLNAKLASQFCI